MSEHRNGAISRFVRVPCPRCGKSCLALNPVWARQQRKAAEVTLKQMAAMCNGPDVPGRPKGVSISLLSSMERGVIPFLDKHAEVYLQVLERRRRAGEPS